MKTDATALPLTAWWHPLLAGLGFYAAALLASTTTLMSEGIVFLWPANAVLLVALLRSPRRRWPGFLAAMLVAEVLADSDHFTLLQSVLFGLVNAGEVTLAALWLGRLDAPPRFSFDRLRAVSAFCLGVLGVTCALAGAAGALVFRYSVGGTENLWTYWQLWWLGDSLGLLMLTPPLLAWVDAMPWVTRHRMRLEFAALLVLAVIASLLVFSCAADDGRPSPALPVLLFPLAIWVAARFGARSVAGVCLIIGVIAIECTRRGLGPFADANAAHAVLQVQAFLFSFSLSALLIAAVVNELRQRNADLRLRNRAIESIGEGVVIADALQPDLPITYVNPSFEALTGYSLAEVIGRNCRFLQGEHRDQPELPRVQAALRQGEPVHVLLRNYRKDGSLFWNDLTLAPVRDADQQLIAYVGIQRDVTAMREAESQLQAAHAELTRVNQALEQRVAERTQALEHANQRLINLAHTDSLTGIWNRRYFLDAARSAIDASARHGRPLCLLMIDADHFKAINDQHGHGAGDQALLSLTCAVQADLRSGDLLARFGGEEFIALLTDTPLPEALHVAERWRAAVASLRIPHDGLSRDGPHISLTVSIGVAQWRPALDLNQLVRMVDERLYAAKTAGRNRVCG